MAIDTLWTPASSLAFHTTVQRLYQRTPHPARPRNYRQEARVEDAAYILSSGEELHAADHIAFLAQNRAGADSVSAVTVEEDREGGALTFRVAANRTPKRDVVPGLLRILRVLERYARREIQRMECEDQLFLEVVAFSCQRIHGRLMSRHEKQPWERGGKKTSLYHRLRARIRQIKPLLDHHQSVVQTVDQQPPSTSRDLIAELNDLATTYEEVDRICPPQRTQELLQRAIRKSSQVSKDRPHVSLESRMQALGISDAYSSSREILEVDKLARYFDLCRDLINIARRPAYRNIFSNIRVEPVVAPPYSLPPAATTRCRVHGEVQLVLYHEQHPSSPRPRAIGSSKSACFLCDLFLTTHGQFRISYSHQGIYPAWTVPEAPWMNAVQRQRFEGIMTAMTTQMQTMLRRARGNGLAQIGSGCESRAHLLFPPRNWDMASASSVRSAPPRGGRSVALLEEPALLLQSSSPAPVVREGIDGASNVNSMKPTPLPTPPQTPSTEFPPLSPPTGGSKVSLQTSLSTTTVHLAHLPIDLQITKFSKSFRLQLNRLSFIFEFLEIMRGGLYICVAGEGEPRLMEQEVNVEDVVVGKEVQVKCEQGEDALMLRIRDRGRGVICVTFTWSVDRSSFEQ